MPLRVITGIVHRVTRHPCRLPAPMMDSRVKHGNDRKWKASRHCVSFFYSFGELFRLKSFLMDLFCKILNYLLRKKQHFSVFLYVFVNGII